MDFSPSSSKSSSKHTGSSSSSSHSKSSKKRSRETENGDGIETHAKKAKLASGAAQPMKIESAPAKEGGKSSWEEKCRDVLLEKMLLKRAIYLAKCASKKCPGVASGASVAVTSSPSPSNASELDFSIPLACGKPAEEHSIVWHEDVEAKQKDGVAPRIQRLYAMIVCTRWMCAYWNPEHSTFKWVAEMITRIQAEIESFKDVIKARPALNPSPVLKTLLSSLTDSSTTPLAKVLVSCKISSTMLIDHPSADSINEALQTRISLLVALDNLYYLLYHYSLVSPLSSPSPTNNSTQNANSRQEKKYSKKKIDIATPAEYFRLFLDPVREEVDEMMKRYWKLEFDRMTRKSVQNAIGTFDAALQDSSTNPLLAIWHLRLMEYVRFYYATGLSKSSKEMESAIASQISGSSSGKKASKIKRVRAMQQSKEHASEPVCSDALQAWRDASRDWPSLLFAYAVPTPLALDTIAEFGSIVEIGAGTGYWANLLRNRGVKISAFDSVPTTSSGEQNEFHANVPSFCEVIKAGTAAVRKFSGDSALFLCFPPPDDTMALEALRLYSGQHVIHVGEWEGFTGSLEFETQLFQHFRLIRRVELPNWQDTCYDLTVWERISTAGSLSSQITSKVAKASKTLTSNPTAESALLESPLKEAHRHLRTVQCFSCGKLVSVLRRCRCCRIVAFCSKACASQGARQHASIHALQGIFTPSADFALDYNQTKHYRVLRAKAF